MCCPEAIIRAATPLAPAWKISFKLWVIHLAHAIRFHIVSLDLALQYLARLVLSDLLGEDGASPLPPVPLGASIDRCALSGGPHGGGTRAGAGGGGGSGSNGSLRASWSAGVGGARGTPWGAAPPPPVGADAGRREFGFSRGDFRATFGAEARTLESTEASLMRNFDSVYMEFISDLASVTKGAREGRGKKWAERRVLERAFADALRECFSDPSIIALLRRATTLRLRQQGT